MSAKDEAERLLNRLDSQQFAFTASDFEQRVADRKLALDIITVAIEQAEARGRQETEAINLLRTHYGPQECWMTASDLPLGATECADTVNGPCVPCVIWGRLKRGGGE